MARSKFLSSVASFTRVIKSVQVSLPEASQIAQMRSSIALALDSSGAILSPVNKCRDCIPFRRGRTAAIVRRRQPIPRMLGHSRRRAGEARQAPRAVTAKTAGNRSIMPTNLFARRYAASRKSAQSGAVNAAEMGSETGAELPPAFFPSSLALAGLEAALGLVDDIDPALAAHDAIVAVAAPQRFQ